MNDSWRTYVLECLQRGDSPDRIDRELTQVAGLSEEDRAALWMLAWSQATRPPARRLPEARPVAESRRSVDREEAIRRVLDVGRRETGMDVAVLGEIRDGREFVRAVAGDAGSFGMQVGGSLPIEETYCQHLLQGRIGNVVPDAAAEPMVRDLALTQEAGVGAYVGVPVTTRQAQLYVLCCLAHEQRPQLGERDVLLLRGLAESVFAELGLTT